MQEVQQVGKENKNLQHISKQNTRKDLLGRRVLHGDSSDIDFNCRHVQISVLPLFPISIKLTHLVHAVFFVGWQCVSIEARGEAIN